MVIFQLSSSFSAPTLRANTDFFSKTKMGKPRGLRTARKHVKNRRNQVWADLDYKKAHLGTRWKANPFGGASHAKGIVLEKVKTASWPNTCLFLS